MKLTVRKPNPLAVTVAVLDSDRALVTATLRMHTIQQLMLEAEGEAELEVLARELCDATEMVHKRAAVSLKARALKEEHPARLTS